MKGLGLLATMTFLLWPAVPFAQGSEHSPVEPPILHQEMESTEAVPGQPLSFRLTVLVPSYMPQPVIWPNFDTPDVIVRVPSRGTGPVTERVSGESWSGITRRYEITPLQPGDYILPPSDLTVTWADPETNEPRQSVVPTAPAQFSGVVPKSAVELTPFLAAAELTLERAVEGDPLTLTPGDSLQMSVTATVTGVSPLILPRLLELPQIKGLAAYPDEPRVSETGDGGTRVETVTFVAEGRAEGTLPAIALDWYDLGSDVLQTARLDPLSLHADGPRGSAISALATPKGILATSLTGVLLILTLLALRPLRSVWRSTRATWRASESWAWHRLLRHVKRQDFRHFYAAFNLWATRYQGPDPRQHEELAKALTSIGAARYGGEANETDSWRALRSALAAARRTQRRRNRPTALPPLNPSV